MTGNRPATPASWGTFGPVARGYAPAAAPRGGPGAGAGDLAYAVDVPLGVEYGPRMVGARPVVAVAEQAGVQAARRRPVLQRPRDGRPLPGVMGIEREAAPRGGSFRTVGAPGAPGGQRPAAPGRRAAWARTVRTRCAAWESTLAGAQPPAREAPVVLPPARRRSAADPVPPRPRRRTVQSAGAGARPPAAASVGRVGCAARLPPPKGRATAGERARDRGGGGACGASGAGDGGTGRSRMLPMEPSAPPRARMSVPTDSVSVETRSRGRKDVRGRHR